MISLSMRSSVLSAIVAIGLFGAVPAFSAQELTEMRLTQDIMSKSLRESKSIIAHSGHMLEDARPFSSPRYAARFRFEPSDSKSRSILSVSRTMGYRLRMLSGVTCHTEIQGLPEIFKDIFENLEKIDNGSKRTLRAIRDRNSALYLASAKTINDEARKLINNLAGMETLLNGAIHITDANHEDL
ncbi:MAG: hypothetical protein HQM10_16480 [Candidatus Riflebacteria bacterium]|nr:hypothetical protein [Candidatus Riflebacteria bacterium]